MQTDPRNIAVFIDGTWNRAGTKSTNVRKLFQVVLKGSVHGRRQVKLYLSGVGTPPAADLGGLVDSEYDAQLALHLDRLWPPGLPAAARSLVEGGFGAGTTNRIRAAYHFVCKNFDRPRGDRVYLFGFSRGAFAARSLAGFMEHVGMLLADKLEHVDRAYELYEMAEDARQSELAEFLHALTGHRRAGVDGKFAVPVHFLGVWDTVGSLGLPSRLNWFSAPFTEFHQVDVPPNVVVARHALALHEVRSLFEPLLWKSGRHRDVKQVWFAGAHADVGGGYPMDESALSDTALRWMAGQAAASGLSLDTSAPWLMPAPFAPTEVHHEIRGMFLATLPVARRWLEDAKDEDLVSFYFHRSALEHLRHADEHSYKHRHPFVNAALRRVDGLALPRLVRLRLLGQEIAP